mgnify:CR=1 FL=1
MGLQGRSKRNLKKGQFFLEGNIPKAVLSVCLPMALFQLINELFRVFDLVITSQINPESVSAVSFFNQLNNSIVSVGTGLSIGAGILIAGLYGAGEYERLKTTVNTTFLWPEPLPLSWWQGLSWG